MAQTALDLTLEAIRDIVVGEVKFLCGVGGQIKGAQQELKRMRIILEEFDTVQDQSALNFIKEMKRICYNIEDAVDAYAFQVLLRRQTGSILRRIVGAPLECYRVHDAGTQMASVNSEISSLNARMESHKKTKDAIGQEQGRRKLLGWPRETYGLEADKDFVGMESDLKLVVSRLLMKDSGPVVSIWGMGGSGKTTLAEQAYHDNDVRSEFQAFAWIYVSRTCKTRSIFQGLLNQLNSRSYAETNAMEEEEFVREIYAVLRSLKCLIVVDDVWEVHDWRSVFGNLRVGDTQSKVLVTTRKQVVAELGFAHPLGVLSPDDAWKLLQKKAFPRTSHPQDLDLEPETLEQIGRNIVRKCGYLPLAIRVVGGILSKRATSDWKEMNDKIDLYVSMADGSKDEEIKQVLSLSYDDLPYHLKPCFLYFSRFPHDENISAEELYLLWMAEGIVSAENQGQHETLMDLAKQYLRDLASRSMVQVQVDEITAPQEFQSCRLHDLLRDLCTETAGEEEYLKLVDCRGGKNSSRGLSFTNSRLRRLAVYLEDPADDISLKEESSQRIRSLFIHVPKPVYLFQDLLRTLPPEVKLEKFKFLRVLGFQYVKFEDKKALAGIGKLIHLRLLAFWYCHLLELPSSIGDFPSLQTLNFETRSFLLVPDVLWKLKRLKYLNVLNAGCTNGKLSLRGLDELEVLHGFSSNNCKVADLSALTMLRSLKAEIYGNADLFLFIDSIEGSGLRLNMSAVVICDCDFTSTQEGESLLRKLFNCVNIYGLSVPGIAKIGRLPRYELGFFPNLSELSLQGGEIEEDPMATLEKLPKLRKLILVEKSFVGREMSCHAEGFAQLRYLELNRLSNLEVWRIDDGAMKQLLFLKLSSCNGLDMIPDGIRFLTALKTLEIADMSANFQQRIGGGGEDYNKVKHVNSIFIHF